MKLETEALLQMMRARGRILCLNIIQAGIYFVRPQTHDHMDEAPPGQPTNASAHSHLVCSPLRKHLPADMNVHPFDISEKGNVVYEIGNDITGFHTLGAITCANATH